MENGRGHHDRLRLSVFPLSVVYSYAVGDELLTTLNSCLMCNLVIAVVVREMKRELRERTRVRESMVGSTKKSL